MTKFARRIFIATLAAGCAAGSPDAAGAKPREARVAGQVAALLERYPLVGIGEMHRRAKFHALLRRIVGDPRVFCRIDDIVVEFGNGRLQPIADRYISGAAVPLSDKRSMWRDTGQWLVWDSPVYERFFEFVRMANARRICGNHKVRVLLGDPPIDWSKVHDAADYERYGDRLASYVGVVEREVLAKRHRALLVIGGTHLMKAQAREFTGGLTEAQVIERDHPRTLFSILPVDSATAARLHLAPAPSLTFSRTTSLGRHNSAALVPPSVRMQVSVDGKRVWKSARDLHWPSILQVADGLLNIGDPDPEALPDPAVYADPVYRSELRRRGAILKEVYGFDFLPDLDAALNRPAAPSH